MRQPALRGDLMLGLIRQWPAWSASLEELLITYLPGEHGEARRYEYWKKRLKHLGENVLISPGVYFQNPARISIGDHCWIDRDVIIMAGDDDSGREKVVRGSAESRVQPGDVRIGAHVHVAPRCIVSGIAGGVVLEDCTSLSANTSIYAFCHHYRSVKDPSNRRIHFAMRALPPERQCMIVGPVYIGNNTGVALNAVILPGTSIEEDSFVAINSVVGPGRFEANSLLRGEPATRVAERFKSVTGSTA
jgi:acetyltransferase-like isoleucine patch superfamily enzyme